MFEKKLSYINVSVNKNSSVKIKANCNDPRDLVSMLIPIVNICKNSGFTEEYINNLISYVFQNDVDKLRVK